MSAARDRLSGGYYNSQPKTVANPGGMDDGGHVINFPLAAVDIGVVAGEIVADNDAAKAAILASNEATTAAVAADNADTVAAVGADNDATQAAILASNEATATAVAESNAATLAAIVADNAETAGLVDADAAAAFASKQAAAASEGNAADAATTANAAAVDAKRTVANNFPDRLDATGSWFTEADVGDPGAVAVPDDAAIAFVAGYGYEYTKANGQGQLFTRGVLSAAVGKVYEVEAEVEWTVKGGAETPAFTVGVQALDAAFASEGGQVQAALQPVGAVGVEVFRHRFGYAAPAGGAAWPSPGVAVWLRPFVLFNRKSDDSGAAAASTARVRRLTVRDVTAVVAAEIEAADAAASAASVAQATDAEAIAGAGVGLMNATRVGMAIDALAVRIGGVLDFASPPNSKWLPCSGLNYLNSSYPDLAPLMAAYIKPATIRISGVVSSGRAAYGNGLHMVFGRDATGYCCWTSPDAVTWTRRATPWANHPTALAFGNGRFVAALDASIYSTTDGQVWTAVAATGLTSIRALLFANGKWVAAGLNGSDNTQVASTSTDLGPWGGVSSITTSSASPVALAYNPGADRWVLVTSGAHYFYSSGTLAVWDTVSSGGLVALGAAWTGTKFVGLTASNVISSPTGTAAWSSAANPSAFAGNAVAMTYDGANLIVVSSTGVVAKSSDEAATWSVLGSIGATAVTALTRASADPTTPIVLAQGSAGIKSGLDTSLTQFVTPTVAGRASNLTAYIKALP